MADHVLQLESGRIIMPAFHSSHHRGNYKGFCYYSDDDGDTWQVSDNKMELPGIGAQEPSMVVLNDGSLLAAIRTSLGTVHKSYSYDEGENWTAPVSTGLSSPWSSPLLKRLPSTGDLLLMWNNSESDPTAGHYPRDPLTASISRDKGETWEMIKDFESNPGGQAASPAVTFLGDKALVSYWYIEEGRVCPGNGGGVRLKIIPIDWFSLRPGDFDEDGDVDGVDFFHWQMGYPTASGSDLDHGDADGDGDTDGIDFGLWQANYPTMGAATTAVAPTIPEPATLGFLIMGGFALLRRRKA